MSIRTYWTVLTIVLGLNPSYSNLFGEDRFYMLVFGAQAEPNLPRLTHTYAVFVRVGTEETTNRPYMQTYCVSWMPRSLTIEPLRLFPEQGVNMGLEDTNRHFAALGTEIAVWGPYRIRKELFDMAVRQVDHLNRNEIDYICLDRRFRGAGASNCTHAVCDLDTTQPPLQTGIGRGHGAAALVVRHLSRYILPADGDVAWLPERLNLKPTEVRFVDAPSVSRGM